MKKLLILCLVLFNLVWCSLSQETFQEENNEEDSKVIQEAPQEIIQEENDETIWDKKYQEAMAFINWVEERWNFDPLTTEFPGRYKKEICWDVGFYDMWSSMDGPTYYIDLKNKKVLSQWWDCRTPWICFGDLPPKEWLDCKNS